MEKKRLLFISNMASPYQVKFCYALQEYFDAEFWFYVQIEPDRPEWWKVPLGDKCKVMEKSGRFPVLGYYSLGALKDLDRFKPDIILMGGFMNWHWLISKWAKKNGAKIALMGESLRYAKSDRDATDELMTRENSPKKLKMLNAMFSDWDLYIGMGEVATAQFKEELGFPEEKVEKLEYPVDIDDYFDHPLREKEKGDAITILFANRLIERYQPLFALEVFKKLQERHPNIHIKLNNEGPLKESCQSYIEEHELKNAGFLKKICSWNEMNTLYRDADILILPATYSNGNMTITEAGASGMGIVISDKVNNMGEEMKEGENCFICELDVDKFVESVERYIENPELLSQHGKKSREFIDNKRNYHIAKLYYDTLCKHGLLD